MTTRDGLVGKFFHIFKKDFELFRFGCVCEKLSDGYYLVEFIGCEHVPNTFGIYHIGAMVTSGPDIDKTFWHFYDTFDVAKQYLSDIRGDDECESVSDAEDCEESDNTVVKLKPN